GKQGESQSDAWQEFANQVKMRITIKGNNNSLKGKNNNSPGVIPNFGSHPGDAEVKSQLSAVIR
ncbi:MAG TPA: hypothetical protein VKA27_02575, partial [Sunxiuqinia sp.]|nr:hypothetical protein [Sunxiuqinia sp.]